MMEEGNYSQIKLVQNPAFGSILLWSFGRGFQSEAIGELVPMTNLFLVLPIILHAETLEHVRSTQLPSGLGRFAMKLAERRENLLAIHGRALKLRSLTLDSLGVAISSKIMKLDYKSACVRANEANFPVLPERLRKHVKCAEKLGKWCGRLQQVQVFSILRVVA